MQHDAASDLGNTVFLIDILATIVAFAGSFWAREVFMPTVEPLHLYSHIFIIPLILALITGALTYFGGYRSPYETSVVSYSWSILRANVVTFGVLLALLFFLQIEYVSRAVIAVFASLEFGMLVGIRALVVAFQKAQIKNGKKRHRILIVGSRSRARELVTALQGELFGGVEIVGFVDPDITRVGVQVFDIPVIGTVENIHDCLKNNVIDEVIIAIPRSLLHDAEPIAHACEEEGIRLRFMADVFNIQVANISLSKVKGIPLLTLEPIAQDRQQLMAKRLFDFTCTVLALPLFLPLFLLVAIAIKLDSPGPVFFVQQRVGLRKHLFSMFKFRSMYVDAEERLKDIEHLNEAEGPIFKMKNDPRITRVGKFIRRTSIDELPQFINVLRGEMSLVGPRPMSLRDVDLFDKGIQRKRFSVQPGLTCLWQISGRSDLPFEKWLELDLEYIASWSFWLDFKILLKTMPAVLISKGAV